MRPELRSVPRHVWSFVLLTLVSCSHEDELDQLRQDRRFVEQPDPMIEPQPCSVAILQPVVGAAFGELEDLDLQTAEVQIGLSVQVANCEATKIHFGLCLGTEQGPLPPAEWLGEVPNATGLQQVRMSLPRTPGTLLPCVQADHLQALAITRACNGEEVACGAPAVCHTDTATNPMRCGDSCAVCAGAQDGAAACVAGACTVQCNPGYRFVEGRCRARPSCKGQETACAGKDCCAEALIREEAGQELRFVRGYDASQNRTGLPYFQPIGSPTVVVRPFYLDSYEVTVGRFRNFVDAYDGWLRSANPKGAHGSHPSNADSGWREAWSFDRLTLLDKSNVPVVPSSRAELIKRVTQPSCSTHFTFTETGAGKDDLPMNCVDFFVAFMFCIWDSDSTHSRLPTEAEWHAAASGGGQQRAYPWSAPDYGSLVLDGRAVFNQGERTPFAVGATAAGAGRWGSFDLGGNVLEWVRDTLVDTAGGGAYVADSDDPIQLSGDDDALQDRVLRGGSFKHSGCSSCDPALELRNVARRVIRAHEAYNDVGFRCARNY
jgi:formylglycine-generating enzyme